MEKKKELPISHVVEIKNHKKLLQAMFNVE